MSNTDLIGYTHDFLTEFIQLYRSFPCLWQVRFKGYKDRLLRNRAYDALVQKLREVNPIADRETVIRKINTLRTAFRREYKKVRSSQRMVKNPRQRYKSSLWYYDILKFVAEQNEGTSLEEDRDFKNVPFPSDVCQEEMVRSFVRFMIFNRKACNNCRLHSRIDRRDCIAYRNREVARFAAFCNSISDTTLFPPLPFAPSPTFSILFPPTGIRALSPFLWTNLYRSENSPGSTTQEITCKSETKSERLHVPMSIRFTVPCHSISTRQTRRDETKSTRGHATTRDETRRNMVERAISPRLFETLPDARSLDSVRLHLFGKQR